MRRNIFILAVWLAAACLWADGAKANPKVLSRDGTLVIQANDAQTAKKKAGSEDTLYELLGQEVQVFIFNNKTRVWPRVQVHSGFGSYKSKLSPRDPRLDPLIHKYAQIYGVDPSLVRAVMRHESGFNSAAVSPKGAQGLMQLMPGTAALMGVRDPFDPEQNIAGGVGYLRHCLDRFQQNVPLAVAAYNAGPESVARCGTIPPYQETQLFVNNVMGTYAGPVQAAPPAKAGSKGAAAASGKGGKAGGKLSKETDPPGEKSPDAPRRPRPKIIEVRSPKSKSAAVVSE
jgi:hypothetical protein